MGNIQTSTLQGRKTRAHGKAASDKHTLWKRMLDACMLGSRDNHADNEQSRLIKTDLLASTRRNTDTDGAGQAPWLLWPHVRRCSLWFTNSTPVQRKWESATDTIKVRKDLGFLTRYGAKFICVLCSRLQFNVAKRGWRTPTGLFKLWKVELSPSRLLKRLLKRTSFCKTGQFDASHIIELRHINTFDSSPTELIVNHSISSGLAKSEELEIRMRSMRKCLEVKPVDFVSRDT